MGHAGRHVVYLEDVCIQSCKGYRRDLSTNDFTSTERNDIFFPRSGSRSTSLSNVTSDLGWILELIIRRAKKEFDSIRIFRDLH